MTHIRKEFQYGGKTVSIDTAEIAPQADGAHLRDL